MQRYHTYMDPTWTPSTSLLDNILLDNMSNNEIAVGKFISNSYISITLNRAIVEPLCAPFQKL